MFTMLLQTSVQSGDTLTGVSKKFGVSVAEIAKQNNIDNPDRISVNQKLTITK